MELYPRKFDTINECMNRLSEIKKDSPTLKSYRASWKDRDSAERNLHKMIEAAIGVGKMLVSDRGLREPGNNREVFAILEEEGFFPSEFIPLADKMIGMRNIIVHGYDRIDDAILYGVLEKDLKDIKNLVDSLMRAWKGR